MNQFHIIFGLALFTLFECALAGTIANATNSTASNDGQPNCDLCSITCSSGSTTVENTGCNRTYGVMSSNCPSTAFIEPMTDALRNYILNGTNYYRNYIASGSNPNLAAAYRMPQVTWDYSLEYEATYKLHDCQYTTHDECRNTCDCDYVGQNLGYCYPGSEYPEYYPDGVFFDWANSGWYAENVYATNDEMACMPPSTPNEIYHFVQQMIDQNDRMGCGIMKYETIINGEPTYFSNICCNFGRSTIAYFPIYTAITSGQKAGQGCTTGTDPYYTSLCSVDETVDINTLDWSQYCYSSR